MIGFILLALGTVKQKWPFRVNIPPPPPPRAQLRRRQTYYKEIELLPTITTLTIKLKKTRAEILQAASRCPPRWFEKKKKVGNMMSDPQLVAAAVIHPTFRTSCISDDSILKLGKRNVLIDLLLPHLIFFLLAYNLVMMKR